MSEPLFKSLPDSMHPSPSMYILSLIPILNHDDIEAPRKERRRCTVQYIEEQMTKATKIAPS